MLDARFSPVTSTDLVILVQVDKLADDLNNGIMVVNFCEGDEGSKDVPRLVYIFLSHLHKGGYATVDF